MSTYITGDPAGVYTLGRGPGLMSTPRGHIPGYGADASSGYPWATIAAGAALGGLLEAGKVYLVARALGVQKAGKIAMWTGVVTSVLALVSTAVLLANEGSTTVPVASVAPDAVV